MLLHGFMYGSAAPFSSCTSCRNTRFDDPLSTYLQTKAKCFHSHPCIYQSSVHTTRSFKFLCSLLSPLLPPGIQGILQLWQHFCRWHFWSGANTEDKWFQGQCKASSTVHTGRGMASYAQLENSGISGIQEFLFLPLFECYAVVHFLKHSILMHLGLFMSVDDIQPGCNCNIQK